MSIRKGDHVLTHTAHIVDAHVGKALFADAIIGALRNKGKTVLLVTHALHFLSQCDYIYTLEVIPPFGNIGHHLSNQSSSPTERTH